MTDAASKPHDRPLAGSAMQARCRGSQRRGPVRVQPEPPACCRTIGPARTSVRRSRSVPDRLLRVPGFISAGGGVQPGDGDAVAAGARPRGRHLPSGQCFAARKVRDERGNRTNVYCVGVAPPVWQRQRPARSTRTSSSPADLVEHEGNEDLASDAGLVTAVEAEPAVLFPDRRVRRFPHHRRPEEGPAPVQRADGADEALQHRRHGLPRQGPTPTRSGTRSSISRASASGDDRPRALLRVPHRRQPERRRFMARFARVRDRDAARQRARR